MHALFRVVGRVCLVLAVSAADAWAQSESTISGRVVASANGSALAGAVVVAQSGAGGEPRRVTTDAEGRFEFSQVIPGDYVLSATLDGFAPRSLRAAVAPREVRPITLSLDVAGLAVEVSVAGSAPDLPSTHSPSSTMVTAETLEHAPSFARTNLADAILSSAPGMIRGHDDFVHVRGHEVALNPLINGIGFWENTHSLLSAGLTPDVIESASVMTGGFPAEYGNRFGGVVDIVTKSGLRMQGEGTFTAGGGEAGRRHVALEYGGHRGGFGYFLLGSLHHSDRFLSPPDPEAVHDDGQVGRFFAQIDGAMGTGLLRVMLMGDRANVEIPKTPADEALRPLANAEQRTRQQSAIVTWSQPWSGFAVSASGYQRRSHLRLLPADGPLTARADLDRKLLTIGGKADATRVAGASTLKLGVDVVRLRPEEVLAYDYQGYRDLTHLLGLPHIHVSGQRIVFAGTETGGQVSAYVQSTTWFGEIVAADLGVRFDHHHLLVTSTHASPRVNVAVRLGGSVQLHTSYNRFFVPPPIEGVLSSSAGLTRSIQEIGVALSPLRPMTEDQAEAGVTMSLGGVVLGATGYYRTTDNPVHTTVWPDSRIYSYASFERARAYGAELRGTVRSLARLGVTAYANYAVGRVTFWNPVTGGFIIEGAHLNDTSSFLAPMDQRHTLTAGGTYRHAVSGVWAGSTVEFGDGTPLGHGAGDHEHGEGEDHGHAEPGVSGIRVPSHFLASASVGVDLFRRSRGDGRLTLRLDVENLANTPYRIAQEGPFSPAQFSIPRLISITAKVRF